MPKVQQGQGANASGDPTGILRMGQLSRTPGEPVEMMRTIPDRLPKELLPEGAVFSAASSSASLVVAVVTVPPEIVLEPWRFQWKLEEIGWVNYTPSRFGFMPAIPGAAGRFGGGPGLVSVGAGLQLCKAQDFADISFWRIENGPRYLRVAVGPDPRRSCAARPLGAFNDVPLPTLELPAGIRSMGGGGGGGLDDIEARSRLDLTSAPAGTTADALAAEFVRQMKGAGWKLESGPTADGIMSTARMTNRSRAGDPVTAIVLVTMLTDTPFVDAIVRVVRNKPVR